MVEEKAYRAFCLSSCFFLICSACRFSFAVGSYGFHFRWAGEISWRICAQDDSFIWKALISNLTVINYLIPGSASDTFHVICNDVLLPQDDVLPSPIFDHPQVLQGGDNVVRLDPCKSLKVFPLFFFLIYLCGKVWQTHPFLHWWPWHWSPSQGSCRGSRAGCPSSKPGTRSARGRTRASPGCRSSPRSSTAGRRSRLGADRSLCAGGSKVYITCKWKSICI